MASGNSELSIVVKLIDDASSALRSMSSSMSSSLSETTASLEQLSKTGGTAKQWQDAYTADATNFINQQDEATAATKEVDAATEHSGRTFSGMIKTMVEYTLAWQGVASLEGVVSGFFKTAISQAMEADDTMAQLRTNLQNAGLSYEALAPKIADVAQQNVALGFTDDETAASLGKLLLTTGNYNQALSLNHLAMDLARSKGIDLGSATQLVEEVMAGNTRVMKQYGVSLDSASTSAEALSELQQQVGGTAEESADTTAGHWRAVQAQWQGMEQELGEQLLPILDQLFTAFEDHLPEIEELFSGLSDVISGTIDVASKLFDVANEAAAPFRALGDAIGNVVNVSEGLGWQQLSVSEALGQSGTKTTSLTSGFGRLATSVKGAGSDFSDITNRIKGADSAAESHAQAIAKLSDEYDKMRSAGIADLGDLASAFETKMDSINQSIASTIDQINDLSVGYAQTQRSDVTRVADDIVASETRIADLKRQIGRATTAEEAGNLDQELNQEQLNYESSLQFRQEHAADIAIAEKRASETSIQREIEDYNTKEGLDALVYQKKLDTLHKQLADEQEEAKQETVTFLTKVNNISKIMDDAQAYFNKLSAERVATTTKEVDAEIQEFQRLASAISSAKSATTPLSPSSLVIPHFAEGGIVNGPTIALVGEAGPEAIIPLSAFSGGSALGGFSLPAGGGIVINITGNTISKNVDMRNLAQAVGDELVRTLRLNQRLAI